MFNQSVSLLRYIFVAASVFPYIVSASFGLGGIPLTPADPPIETANATGHYQVGIRSDTHMFHGNNYTLFWYYPAMHSDQSTPFVTTGGIKGQAVFDAPNNNAGAPYPMILFSPGLAAYPEAYYFYAQNLASHGYIVVSIEHLDSTRASPTSNSTIRTQALAYQSADQGDYAVETLYTEWFRSTQLALSYRPQEIEFGLDTVLAVTNDRSSPFYGTIDKENIGLSGHSLGAFYTFLIGGGMPIYCDYPISSAALNTNNSVLVEVSPCAFPARKALPGPFALKDYRIKAIIPLAAPFFINETQIPISASKITIPTMIITGDDLQLESTRNLQLSAFENTSGPSYFVMVTNTSHYLVADAYGLNSGFAALQSNVNLGADFTEKANVYMTYSAAFFDLYLKGKIEAKTVLHTVISDFVAELKYNPSEKKCFSHSIV